jgi:hypothetical protein
MKLLKWLSAFQILFYPGSHIPKTSYQPLLSRLHHSLTAKNISCDIQFASYLCPKHIGNNTILIGHSFGGYFALKDAKKYPDKVKGVILLHSHFNSRHKAIYPAIRQKNVKAPTLVLLADKDERLPIKTALDDLFEKVENGYTNKMYIVNKNYTHFSGIGPDLTSETETIASQMSGFLEALRIHNYSIVPQQHDEVYSINLQNMIPSAVILSKSINLLDALLSITSPASIWDTFHWWLFLCSQPLENLNYIFDNKDYIYMKTIDVPLETFTRRIEKWSFDAPIRIHTIYLPSIHPAILAWLHLPLFVRKDKEGVIHYPVLVLPVNENKTYYKLPHPNRIFENQF